MSSVLSALAGTVCGTLMVVFGIVGFTAAGGAPGPIIFAATLIAAGLVCLPFVASLLRRGWPAVRHPAAPPVLSAALVALGMVALGIIGLRAEIKPANTSPVNGDLAANRNASSSSTEGERTQMAHSYASALLEAAKSEELRLAGDQLTDLRSLWSTLDAFEGWAEQLRLADSQAPVAEMAGAKQKLRGALAAAQLRSFPKLRAAYAKLVVGPGSALWREDVSVSVAGPRSREVRLVGPPFTRNNEIVQAEEGLSADLSRLRFGAARYRWSPNASHSVIYDLQAPPDDSVGSWKAGRFSRVD